MKIHYNETDDILFIQFNNLPVVKDISYGWNVNVGLTDRGVGQITILDAQTDGVLPLELAGDVPGILKVQHKAEKDHPVQDDVYVYNTKATREQPAEMA